VPRTSSQLAALRSQPGVVSVEVQVPALLAETQYTAEVARVTHAIEHGLRHDQDVVLLRVARWSLGLMRRAFSPLGSVYLRASSPSSVRLPRGHAICWPREGSPRVISPRKAWAFNVPWCLGRSCLGYQYGSSVRRPAILA